MEKLSVVLITRNEERNIRECLESVKWSDEIILVDQTSEDKTVEIAKEYTDKIFITEPKGICNPDREFGVSQTTNDWILLLEADERISKDLKDEIISVINSSESKDIYFVPVKSFFLGRWIRTCGWWPAYIPRLFRKGTIRFQSEIHTNGELLSNKIEYLKNPLLHYSYNSIDDWIDRLKRYTTVISKEYYNKGMKVNFINTLREVIIRPMYFFLLKYIKYKGYKDGWRGIFICLSSAITIITAYFKLIELYEKNENRH